MSDTPAPSGWQPMATAPRHDVILIYVPLPPGLPAVGNIFIALWDFDHEEWIDPVNGDVVCNADEPTHWMPLPAPPAEESER